MDRQTDPATSEPAFSPAKRRSGVFIWAAPCLAIICAASYGFWRFIYYPTTPQYALDRFFQAVRQRDYDEIYARVHVTGILKTFIPGPKELRQAAERMPGLLPSLESYELGDTKLSGDHATIEATITSGQNNRIDTRTLPVQLVRLNGVWMVDGEWIVRELSKKGLGGILLRGADL